MDQKQLCIKTFYGTSDSAVKIQIWVAISVYGLIVVMKKQLGLDLTATRFCKFSASPRRNNCWPQPINPFWTSARKPVSATRATSAWSFGSSFIMTPLQYRKTFRSSVNVPFYQNGQQQRPAITRRSVDLARSARWPGKHAAGPLKEGLSAVSGFL
jgi:hypothetical protein